MDFFYRMSVPRIECSTLTSSGFLVTSDKIITATHTIAPFLNKEVETIEVIFINEQGKETTFNAEPLFPEDDWRNYEIICLQLSQRANGFETIECMDYRFHTTTECFAYGYPAVAKEKGTSIDLEIRDERKDVDINYGANINIKVKSDPIKDYSGYSGSPLIYNGKAVAVMLEQVSENGEGSRLEAVSLYVYKEYLTSISIPLLTKKHAPEYEEYISSVKYTLKQQLENNLKRNIMENEVNPLGFSISIQPKSPNKEELSFNKVLENNQSAMILSEPGGGKTYLLQMLVLDIIENPQVSVDKIPIYLKAKEWYRGYENIIEGIKKELEYDLPNINNEQIIQGLKDGKYILLIDGLDEVINNKDLFIREIRKINQFHKTKIIMTCRQKNYHNEFYEILTEYALKALSDKQIQEYMGTVFEENVHFGYIIKLKEQLKDLIENPLFLYMTTYVMKEMTSKVIPKNKSELYDVFISYLMQERLFKEGIHQEMTYELDLKKNLIMEFAYLNFRKSTNLITLREVISARIQGEENIITCKKEILQTGILIEENNEIDFFHPSIEEYFVALRLSKLSKEEIIHFVELNYSNEGYYEVFKFTSGLLRNYEQQNLVLDKLETLDIFLYRQCLESRFNFDHNLEGVWSKEYLEEYFTQLRRSYLNIIDAFFENIKSKFYPWFPEEELYKNDNVTIAGALDRANLRLSINIKGSKTEEKNVVVSEKTGAPKMKVYNEDGNAISTPIMTFQSENHWYFDLQQTDFGLDSAREVALYIIKNQLKNLIKKRGLFSYEPPETIIPCVEYILRKLPTQQFSVRGADGKSSKMSLSQHSPQFILKKLFHQDRIFNYMSSLTIYSQLNSTFLTAILFRFTKLTTENIDFTEFLLYQPDIEPYKKAHSYIDLWSDERIKERLKQFFEFYQIGYRTLIEQCFYPIHQHMKLYAVGPVRFEIGLEKYQEKYTGLSIEWTPVETLKETAPVLKEGKTTLHGNSSLEKKQAKIDQELSKFNRKLPGGHSFSSASIDGYILDDTKLRNSVYEKIKAELEYVLGKLN